jgi:hypothetical protein
MRRCWANSLGDCAGPISGEHLITAGLFGDAKLLFIQGMDWCKSELKEVAKKSLVKNVLCASHNSRLSVLDEEAIRVSKVFQEGVRLQEVRDHLTVRRWSVARFEVDGPLFERWFLKTLITLACDGDKKIGPDSLEIGRPSPQLVRVVYGLEQFRGRAGLYLLSNPGLTCKFEDRFEYLPMEHRDCLPGALLVFRGHPFFIYLSPAGITDDAELALPGPWPFGAMANGGVNVRPMFHPRKIRFDCQGRRSHEVTLFWSRRSVSQ